MEKIRLLNQAQDFKKLGINPNNIQSWEDGRRDNSKPGTQEVWYFDAILDDETKVVCYFHPRTPTNLAVDGDNPDIGILITTPDNKTHGQMIIPYPAKDSYFGTDKCDVKIGPHTVQGDFKNYQIHIEPVNGNGLDLHFKALVDPFAQGGTGIIALGNEEQYHYTDLPVVKNEVTGSITIEGKKKEVTGLGYHDHQWMNISRFQAWHHWLWGHLYTENYTVYIYDFVANERFGFTNVPFFGVMDNKTGKVIFSTDGHVEKQTTLEPQKDTGKEFPKKSTYTFTNADGATVKFKTEWYQEIEVRNMYGNADEATKAKYDAGNMSPVYVRYGAKGTVTITDKNGQLITETGDMIYEYPYLGVPDKRANV